MGLKDLLVGGGVAAGANALGGLAKDIRQAIKGKEADPDKQIQYAKELIQIQGEINKVEAQHRSIFVAGWRPFIGWVCGTALLYNYIIRDILIFIQPAWADLPALQMEHLLTVLLGMLGLGGLRTYEKFKGVAK